MPKTAPKFKKYSDDNSNKERQKKHLRTKRKDGRENKRFQEKSNA